MHDEAVQMSSEIELSEYFEAVIKNGPAPRTVVSWISTQLIPAMKEHNYDFKALPVTSAQFAGLINMLKKNEINSNSARAVLAKFFETNKTPEEIVEQFGFRQVSDHDALESIVKQVIEENPSAIENYKNGNKKSMGFLIGQSMKLSKGKANPKRLQEIFKEKL
jgi:aspartyl-tRNA(Asn)/glutamyl-tRNA(Gln) amidotransferase subunit B